MNEELKTTIMSESSSPLEGKYYENKNLESLTKIIDTKKISHLMNDPRCKNIYSNADPFPHIIFKDLWEEEFLESISNEFREFKNWEVHSMSAGFEKRTCGSFFKLPPKTARLIDFCNSFIFIRFLEYLTGISGLIPDPYLLGGGMHSTLNNGFLKLHTDFNWHENLKLYRRLNLLIFLNKNWKDDWEGHLLLVKKNKSELELRKKIPPEMNTSVIFNTDHKSIHGHPFPMKLPEDISRDSIAIYYYSSSKPEDYILAKNSFWYHFKY